MKQSKGLVKERQYRISLIIVYQATHFRICLTLFISLGKLSEDIKLLNSLIHVGGSRADCCNGKVDPGRERSSTETPKPLDLCQLLLYLVKALIYLH